MVGVMLKAEEQHDIISVIIPVYDAENTIGRCLDSILNQTYRNLEIIVVNDGSTDRSEKICAGYQDKDNRIKVYTIDNHGQGYARNYGIEHSNGTYIGFCDADDTMWPNMYETLYKMICNSSADMSGCGHNDIRDGKLIERNSDANGVVGRKEALELFSSGKLIKWACWDKLFRRNSLGSLRFPAQKLQGEDTLFLLHFICNNNVFAYADLGLYNYYRDSSQSFTKRKWGKENLGLTRFYGELYEEVKDYEISSVEENVQARYYENLLSTYIRCCNNGLKKEAGEARNKIVLECHK